MTTGSRAFSDTALILSGGGARAAYQIGVLKAVNEILDVQHSPFDTLVGTSAGAINAVSLAAHCDNFHEGFAELERLWSELTVDHVFRADKKHLLKGLFRFGRSFFHQGVDYHKPLSLLDNAPLNAFLKNHIPLENIQRNIDQGYLKAVSVTAVAYNSGSSVSFFQAAEGLDEWRRYRRVGIKTRIGMEHLLASSAIPMVFPTVRIGRDFYGDGAVRQLAPISPALHLQANKVFVIGVSNHRAVDLKKYRNPPKHPPSMGQMAGHILDSAFVDSMDADIEHLENYNDLLDRITGEEREGLSDAALRPVKHLVISPSRDIDKIAGRHIRYLPKTLKFFLRSSGASASGGGSNLGSFVLFVPSFINELIELGHQDAMWEQEAIRSFFRKAEAQPA